MKKKNVILVIVVLCVCVFGDELSEQHKLDLEIKKITEAFPVPEYDPELIDRIAKCVSGASTDHKRCVKDISTQCEFMNRAYAAAWTRREIGRVLLDAEKEIEQAKIVTTNTHSRMETIPNYVPPPSKGQERQSRREKRNRGA